MSVSSKPYRVLLKRGEFVDLARGDRVVPYKIYYPVEHGLEKMPVILWSHGLGGSYDGAAFISRYIASFGYTIVHVTHKGSDSSLWEGRGGHPWDVLKDIQITPELILERVADIPFVLVQLERLSEVEPEIARCMDTNRIGMSGHSLGAITTQAMAGMQLPDRNGGLVDKTEDRFSCAICYSPVPLAHLSDAPLKDIYGGIDVPVLYMTGTEDNSPTKMALDYKDRLIIRDNAGNDEQYLQVLDGGDHMIYNGTRGKLARNSKRDEHEALILEAVLAFWQAYLKDDTKALEWLKANCMP